MCVCVHKCAKYGSAMWFLLSAQKGKIFLIFLLEGKKTLKSTGRREAKAGGNSFIFFLPSDPLAPLWKEPFAEGVLPLSICQPIPPWVSLGAPKIDQLGSQASQPWQLKAGHSPAIQPFLLSEQNMP